MQNTVRYCLFGLAAGAGLSGLSWVAGYEVLRIPGTVFLCGGALALGIAWGLSSELARCLESVGRRFSKIHVLGCGLVLVAPVLAALLVALLGSASDGTGQGLWQIAGWIVTAGFIAVIGCGAGIAWRVMLSGPAHAEAGEKQ